MSNPQTSSITFTRAEVEAIAYALDVVIAEHLDDSQAAQSAAAKIRDEIGRRS